MSRAGLGGSFDRLAAEGGLEGKSVGEVRKLLRESGDFNCGYAICICRSCGMHWTDQDGDTNTAEVVDTCSRCPRA